jgi:titin
LIAGNYIGTDTTGTQAIGNRFHGIKFDNVTNSVVGGSTPAARNIISGTLQGEGIGFSQGTIGNFIQGNYIGTDVTGNVGAGKSIRNRGPVWWRNDPRKQQNWWFISG